jgi:hypothetical protein
VVKGSWLSSMEQDQYDELKKNASVYALGL